ncbi:type I restriction endonuclease subunit R [Blautia sp.]|uniref:type I restriction endonuclease subunit R n=1 Tax=Blautia sp. TaxID=1955243 RepID=UPI002F40749C
MSAMGYQSEAELENQLIKQLINQDYVSVQINNYDQLLENFRIQFAEFNKDKLGDNPLSDKEWDRLLNYMLGRTVFESAKVLRDKYVLERDDGSKVYVAFVDEDHTKNIWQVTHQTTVVGKYTNRYDVTILCNGLPIVQIELKRRGMDLRQAINQIMRYKKHSYIGLYRYIQCFVVSNGVDTKYFANSDKDILYSLTFFWTDENNIRITNLKEFSVAFLAKDALTRLLLRYTVLNDVEKAVMIMRPYQVYAASKLIDRARFSDKNAYVWHTTGSGKTLTSFKTAQILSQDERIKKVIFLVDRKDLDSQTMEEFNKFEPGSVDVTDNTSVLVGQMRKKDVHLMVTTIQKMSNAVKNKRYAAVMDAYRDEKVIFIIDECHRSQFGDMHLDIVRHFNKAQFFGFTGTPRFEVNGKTEGHIVKTTASLFGDCLHTYLIKDAIFDNNVLGFHVEYIKTVEGDYDINDKQMVQGIDVNEVMASDERMTMIANHIVANHKSKTRNRQYTAIFTVWSIPALIKYYDIFNGIDHELNITGCFSYGANEDGECKTEHSRDALERIMKDYNKLYDTNFSTDTYEAYRKDISDRVKGKKTKQLDILIVVNQFLTGFDAKPLDVLYVDKKLEYHDLLQAFSRTNRVEKETKPFGIVVCYRNLKEETDNALCLFSQTQDTAGILSPTFEEFVAKFNEFVVMLKEVAPTPAAVDIMQDENDQKRFVEIFKALTKILTSLQTFVEYTYDRDKLDLTEQEWEDYKSKYYMLYHKHQEKKEKVSILDDVDFCIELIESDHINVAYIMNLIRTIDLNDINKRRKQIEFIKEQLDRSNNPELYKKIDLIKAFLDQLENGLNPVDIDQAYEDFEAQERQKDIEAFLAENQEVEREQLTGYISEYEFSYIIDEGVIRDSITVSMGLLKKKALVKRIVTFIKLFTEKYQ